MYQKNKSKKLINIEIVKINNKKSNDNSNNNIII